MANITFNCQYMGTKGGKRLFSPRSTGKSCYGAPSESKSEGKHFSHNNFVFKTQINQIELKYLFFYY